MRTDHPGGDPQFVVGSYDLALKRVGGEWRLSFMRFNYEYAYGNETLAAEAIKEPSNA
ncbi:hypothetical protein [Ruegeria jejuensis]|uniref:hypothetical protein n=1 Tax=Ruegeria jejuensis TaxID=3233338 RepID=UPI00355C3279